MSDPTNSEHDENAADKGQLAAERTQSLKLPINQDALKREPKEALLTKIEELTLDNQHLRARIRGYQTLSKIKFDTFRK